MGNVNEKNASTNEEKEVLRGLLEPVSHPDPWTDETEEHAVETALLHGIEIDQPSSSLQRFQQGPPYERDISPYELVAVRGENSDLPIKKNELFEGTGDVSLPLSESIIPETFEAPETIISPPSTSEIDVPIPFTGDIRSLDAVEEFTEHTAPLNLRSHPSQESFFALSPEPLIDEPGRVDKNSEATAPRSLASDRAAAITERILEQSPLSLASNNPLVTPHQIDGIPIIPLPPPPLVKPMGESTAVLSPLILGLSTLAELEFACQSETESCRNNGLPLLMGVPPKELINFEDTILGSSDSPGGPHVAPFAPRRGTVPLPPLSTEDNANLFVSEISSLESSSLGLIVPTFPEPIFSVDRFAPASLHISGDDVESKQSLIEVLSPSIANVDNASEPLAALASQFEAPSSIRAPTVEDEMELSQATTSIPNVDSPDAPRSTSQAIRYAELLPHSSQEAQAVIPEGDFQVPSLALSKIRTYADATDIAMKYPELAKAVLQAPLASEYPSIKIDQSTHEVEDREGAEHSLALSHGGKGFVKKDISLFSSRAALSNDLVNGCVHTPNTPNWAIAPVLDSNSPSGGAKYQRRRCRRRGKKARMTQGDGSDFEDSWLISGPLKSLEATPSIGLKLIKEESLQSMPLPHGHLTPSQELQKKALSNHQKVNKWISESASVIWSPESSADRGSYAVASRSAFLMGARSGQVSGGLLGMGEDDGLEKANLSPTSRVAAALITRENFEITLNDRLLVEDNYSAKRTAGSIPTIVNALAKDLASSEEDWKVKSSKGKKNSVRSRTRSACRSRSAIFASSFASGVSMKSGVPASSRLFQRAIENIGSKNGPQPIYGIPGSVTCNIFPDRQHIEPGSTAVKLAAQSVEPPSRKSSLLDSSTPINAVTAAEKTMTQDSTRDAALCVKGKAEAVTSSGQMVEPCDHMGINDERFVFTFKTLQASIDKHDRNAYMGLQSYAGPLLKTPVEASVVQASELQREGKHSRPPSSKSFIPTGKYVPPPTRDNKTLRRDQNSATNRANVKSGNGAPNQQTKVPWLSWPCVDTNAATIATITSGMNAHAPRYRSSHDVSVANLNQVRNDVIPDVRMHFATGNGPSAGVQRTFRDKSRIVGQYGRLNSGSSLVTRPLIAATSYVNHSGSGVRSHDAMTALDLPEVDQMQGISDPQTQTDVLVSQQQLTDCMAKLSLAQNRTQANMDDTMKSSMSAHGKAKILDSFSATNKDRGLEQASRASSVPVAMKTASFSLQQPSISINSQPQFETQVSSRYPTRDMPPRSQTQMSSEHPPAIAQDISARLQIQASSRNTEQCIFEEFSRRQREETRIVNENLPSRLPRRKT